MKTLSKKTLRIFSLASIALALTIGFSCKKDNTDPKPSDNSGPNGGKPVQPLIATADINFVDDQKTYDFKCYNNTNSTEVSSTYNGTNYQLLMFFESKDKYGKTIDGDPTILIHIQNINGFSEGQVYKIANNTDDKNINFLLANNAENYSAQKVGNNPATGSGELKITSKSGDHIKGTFKFTAKTLNQQSKEVIISNGDFDSKLFVQ